MSDGPCDKCGREALTVPVTHANGRQLPAGCRVAINQVQLDHILESAAPFADLAASRAEVARLTGELERARGLLEQCALNARSARLRKAARAFLASPEPRPTGRKP